jgi:hypothetical protein
MQGYVFRQVVRFTTGKPFKTPYYDYLPVPVSCRPFLFLPRRSVARSRFCICIYRSPPTGNGAGSALAFATQARKKGMVIYVFKRDPISDSSGRSIIPNFAVVIETIEPNTDVVTYSVNKRANNAFDVTNMFTHEEGTIKLINAVGYKGTYTNGLAHAVYVIHAINGNKGFQVILHTTTDTFGTVDAEFLAILHSLRVK